LPKEIETKELDDALDILGLDAKRDHLIRLHRLSRIMAQFGPVSLRHIDAWLGRQELGDEDYALCLLSGPDGRCPDAALSRLDELTPEVRSLLNLPAGRRKAPKTPKSA
jgi:hypothetical protein